MKLLAIGIVLGVVIALGGAVFAHRDAPAAPSAPPPARPPRKPRLTAAESAQIAEVLERVQREYVDEVKSPALIDDALRGLVGGLDPYSGYLDAEEYADLRVSTAGTYAGIGIEVSTADRALRVVRPFRDSPAAAAGIRSGDMISAIDGLPVGNDLDAAMTRMRGPRGSTRQAGGGARRFGAAAGVHRGARAGGRAQRGDGEARRRLRLRAHHHLQRYHRAGFRRRHRAPAPRSRRQAARPDHSTCATTRAACSSPRSKSPTSCSRRASS